MFCRKKTIKELREIVESNEEFIKEQTIRDVKMRLFIIKLKIKVVTFFKNLFR